MNVLETLPLLLLQILLHLLNLQLLPPLLVLLLIPGDPFVIRLFAAILLFVLFLLPRSVHSVLVSLGDVLQ